MTELCDHPDLMFISGDWAIQCQDCYQMWIIEDETYLAGKNNNSVSLDPYRVKLIKDKGVGFSEQ